MKEKGQQKFDLKFRITSHGSEESLKDVIIKNCSMCSPTGLCILSSLAIFLGWIILFANAVTAFLRTRKATRDVYVQSPNESSMRATHLCLLKMALYGLANANEEWQKQSDDTLFSIDLVQSKHISKLFFKRKGK